MTPDDLAAIRAELRAEKCSLVRVPQLCDALEAEMRRAERAEAALDRVRALCEQPDVALLNVNMIRAAIEGDEQ